MNIVDQIDIDKFRAANKEVVFDVLEKEKIESFIVYFDYDSKGTLLINYDSLNSKICDKIIEGSRVLKGVVWKEDCAVSEIIEDLCFEALKTFKGSLLFLKKADIKSFKNNDSFGTFYFHTKKRKIKLSHNVSILEYKLNQSKII